MKYFLTCFFFTAFILANFCNGQNLVPNPSFENFISCPIGPGEMQKLSDWFNTNNASPDYFNACSNPLTVGIPQNIAGYQLPLNGQAYIGVGSYSSDIMQYREIVGVELQLPLVVGEKYFISGYFSRADSFIWSDCATDNLGLQFTSVRYDVTNHVPIDNRSILKFDSVLSNSITWTRLTGSFIADSAYKYLMVGNFYDDQHTVSLCGNGSSHFAYYYFDAVCVTTDSSLNENWIGINPPQSRQFEITTYPNPACKTFSIKGIDKNLAVPYQLYSIENQLLELGTVSGNTNTINCERYSDGVYILRLHNTNLKIIIKH